VIPCDEFQRSMWTDGPEAAPQAHLAECSACRMESRRAGDVLAALHGMRTRIAIAPSELESTLHVAAERARRGRAREVVSHPKFWRGAAVGAAAAAAAATAAFGLIVARRNSARPEVA
jgi:predicted anti-sigma-YlaC factor YlaD